MPDSTIASTVTNAHNEIAASTVTMP
jgi:hypothetical protein